jgi:hypothetical protein
MSLKSRFQVLIVLMLCIGATGNASAEAEAPALATGMEWEYSVSLSLGDLIGQVEEGFEDLFIDGTVLMTVDSLETVHVLGRPYDAWVISVKGDFDVRFTYVIPDIGPLTMTAPAFGEGFVYLDNESYEYVRSSIEITSRFTRFSLTFDIVVEIETSLDIESDTWHFPFDSGDAGTTTGHGLGSAHFVARVNGDLLGENETSIPFTYDSAYECQNLAEVSVDAGSFQAYEVEVSSAGPYLFGYTGGDRREYYSNEVNNNVEVLVYDEEDQLIGEWRLLSYGKSHVGSAMDWIPILTILFLFILLVILTLVFIMLRGRSQEKLAEGRAFPADRVCRRCGDNVPEDESVCPSCGRAIW